MRLINRNKRARLSDILRDAELSDAFSKLLTKYDHRIIPAEISEPRDLSFESIKFYRGSYPIKRLNAKVIYGALKALGYEVPSSRGAISVDEMLRGCNLSLDDIVSYLQKKTDEGVVLS